MAFNKIDLENIKSKIPISSELEKKTKIVKKGKDVWCCCPFHNEKTPSCKINDDLGNFYCFGCGAKGDIFTIYQDLFNYTFLDAVKELSERAGVKINFNNNSYSKQDNNILKILDTATKWFENNLSSENNECTKYLEKRQLSKETVKSFKLGYSFSSQGSLYQHLKDLSFQDKEILKSNVVKKDNNNKFRDFFYKRLIFPISNIQGNVVGFGGRVLDSSNPKYINSPESNHFKKREMLYNLNLAKNVARQKKNLLICEGYMDVISLYQNNIKSVVAPLGTSFTEEQLKLSWRFTDKPTIMFDGDEAGKRASYKAAIMSLPYLLPNKSLQFISLPNNTDPDTYLINHKINNLINLLKNPINLVSYIFNVSSGGVSLNNADQKISYDKYLDDLIESIKDKKIQYFYKSEFKSMFFNKLRGSSSKTKLQTIPKKITSLKRKQIYSFIVSAINHPKVRSKIIETILTNIDMDENESNIIKHLNTLDKNLIELKDILAQFSPKIRQFIESNILKSSIYELFPYSNPKYDSELSLEEIKESTNNLNTRLSNLKKINKSLNTFQENNTSLNWEELQKISNELEDNYKDD
ncbi:MAG: DNA primase [Pelagibacteraceae bacterium]|jgi:DNA primase|nr:DNA primase [Pelagibacteraceae bacterium]